MKAKKFLDQRMLQAEQHLLSYCDKKKPEALHKFRVELKKLKAFYSLLEYCNDHFKKDKKFKVHRKMFRRSSRIRDYDVMRNLMREHKINFLAPTTKSDTKKQWQDISNFCDHTSSYQESLCAIKKELKPFLKSITKKKFKKYLLIQKEKAIERLNNKSNEKELHKARKNIKQIIYLSKLDKKFPNEAYLYLDKLQTAIGKWHDKNILIISLQDAGIKENNKVLQKLKKERTSDLQKIARISERFNS